MNISDLSTTDLKVYHDFIAEKLADIDRKIKIDGGKAIDVNKRQKIFAKLRQIDKEIENRINEIIKEYMSKIKEDIKKENGFDTKKFVSLSKDLQNKFILEFLIKNDIDYDSKKVEEIFSFIQENSKNKAQKTLSLTTNLWLSVSKEKIYPICETKQKKNISEIKIDCCGDFEFGNKIFRIAEFKEKTVPDFPPETEKKAYVSLNKNFVLTLRTRKEGDIIQPFGMPEKMKLKKLFINKGVDKFERNDIILLCKDNEVLWASGVCLSEKLRVNKIPTHTISIEDR